MFQLPNTTSNDPNLINKYVYFDSQGHYSYDCFSH